MVNVKNEYSKLKEVIVGTINNANMPSHGTDLHAINYADKDKIPPKERFYFHDDVSVSYTHLTLPTICSV